MAQFRLRDYQDPLSSYEHNILLNLGIHNPGRYAGFDDVYIAAPGLSCVLRHTNSGYNPKKADGSYYGKFGVFITQQGVVVGETGDIGPLTFDTNAGNIYPRYDLVIATHNYTSIAPGQTATYSIIKGPLGTGLKPILSDPTNQVALGYMRFEPNATGLANAQWQPTKCPDSGDYVDAALYEVNKFLKTQNDNAATGDAVTYATGNLLSLLADGNTFPLAPASATEINGIRFSNYDMQNGLKVSFMITDKIKFKTIPTLTANQIRDGYARVIVPAQLGTKINEFGTPPAITTFWEYSLSTNEVAYITMELIEGEFLITNAINVNKAVASAVKNGTSVFWWGDVNSNFDSNGVGIGDMLGYYMLNGATYTLPNSVVVTVPDLRGRIPIGATTMPSANSPLLDTAVVGTAALDEYGGSYTHTLSESELPSHTHPVSDPGHRHTIKAGNGSAGGGADKGDNDGASDYLNNAFTGISIGNTGGNSPHNNRQPYYAYCWIIKLY